MKPLLSQKSIVFPKSPLRYPGGKARATQHILKLIPSNIDRLVSPFFGGGSVEIAVASLGIKVIGFDLFEPLVQFWKALEFHQDELVAIVKKYYPLPKAEFYRLQKATFENEIERAAVFYVLNRSSFSGSTLSGGMGPGHLRFTPSSIKYLSNFSVNNFSVSHRDFHEVISNCKDFMYLDPPYMIKNNLYGRKGDTQKNFDHQGLFDLLTNKDLWLLSYNNSPEIIELYKGHKMMRPKWAYGMSKNKNSNELLIFSKGYPEISEKLQNTQQESLF